MTDPGAQSLAGWLRALGEAAPAPGGGAAAAVLAAVGAGLASMVAGYSTADVGGFAPSPALVDRMARVRDDARALTERCLEVADDDSRASSGFAAAFRLPGGTDAEVREREAAIGAATLTAARTSVEVGRLGVRALDLLEPLVADGNPVVLADVGVGAAAVAGALRASAVTTEANVAAATGAGHGAALSAAVEELDAAAARADAVVSAVRAAIAASSGSASGT